MQVKVRCDCTKKGKGYVFKSGCETQVDLPKSEPVAFSLTSFIVLRFCLPEKCLTPNRARFLPVSAAFWLFFQIFRPRPKPNGDVLRCISIACSCFSFPARLL